MGKYAPLKEFLAAHPQDRVPMTFLQIEKLLGHPLPPSKKYPAWWSNNPSNNPMTREWVAAGFETEAVSISGERLVFRRVYRSPPSASGGAPPPVSAGATSLDARERDGTDRHPGFGFMKGLIKVEAGFDLTRPFDDEAWDEGYLGGGDRR